MLAPSGVFQAIGFLSWGGRRRGRRSKDAAAKGWGCVATRLFVAPNHGKSAVRETPRSSRLNPSQRSSPLNDKRGIYLVLVYTHLVYYNVPDTTVPPHP